MSATIQYYNERATDYFDQTADIDVAHLRQRFTERLPTRAKILDAGCGSGRDARAFMDQGYEVVAIDASSGMAEQANQRLGVQVEVLPFEEMDFCEEFDGIWACASLLHVPSNELSGVIDRMILALKPGGTFYLSFKVGNSEEERDGRWFHDMTQQGLTDLLTGFDALNVIEMWESNDQGNCDGRDVTGWINALALRLR